MSRKCEISNKGPLKGNNRSKALNATKKTWNVNLKKITIVENGKERKLKVSTKVARTYKNKGLLK